MTETHDIPLNDGGHDFRLRVYPADEPNGAVLVWLPGLRVIRRYFRVRLRPKLHRAGAENLRARLELHVHLEADRRDEFTRHGGVKETRKDVHETHEMTRKRKAETL